MPTLGCTIKFADHKFPRSDVLLSGHRGIYVRTYIAVAHYGSSNYPNTVQGASPDSLLVYASLALRPHDLRANSDGWTRYTVRVVGAGPKSYKYRGIWLLESIDPQTDTAHLASLFYTLTSSAAMITALATVFALASAALAAPAPGLAIEVPAAGPPGFNMCDLLCTPSTFDVY